MKRSNVTNGNMGRPVANKYEVSERRWNRWNNRQRHIFNAMWYELRPSMQYAYLPPGTSAYRFKDWDILRYGLACLAADLGA